MSVGTPTIAVGDEWKATSRKHNGYLVKVLRLGPSYVRVAILQGSKGKRNNLHTYDTPAFLQCYSLAKRN